MATTIKVKWFVDELENVMVYYDVVKVYRSPTYGGTYVEITDELTRVTLVPGTTVYDYVDTDGDPSYWYRTSYFNSVTLLEATPSDPIKGTASWQYCTIQDLRDEGITVAMLSDESALKKITLASKYIEKVTGRWFEPRERTFLLRSRGRQLLEVPAPIILINAVTIVDGRGTEMSESDVDLDDLIIYNRHLTQGLTDPDDRDNPLIAYRRDTRLWRGEAVGEYVESWPNQFQNVRVEGMFGYTELESIEVPGETSPGSQVPNSYGSTPDAIARVCTMLVIRDIPLLSNQEARDDARYGYRITSMRTREQSITLSPLSVLGITGGYTGDPAIDEILALYVAPPGIGVV